MTIDLASLALGALIGLLVAIVGGYLVYRLTRPSLALRMTHVATVIVGSTLAEIPGLKLSFNDTQIPSATRSVVVIWNDGNTPLSPQQFVPADPPRLVFSKDTKVFPPTVLHVSDKASGMKLVRTAEPSESDKSAEGSLFKVEFDYLGPRAGIAAQFIHTGTDLEVLVPAGRLVGDMKLTHGDPWNRWIPLVPFVTGLVLFLLAFTAVGGPPPATAWVPTLVVLPVLVGMGLCFFLLRWGQRLQLRPDISLVQYLLPMSENPWKVGRLLRTASQNSTKTSKGKA